MIETLNRDKKTLLAMLVDAVTATTVFFISFWFIASVRKTDPMIGTWWWLMPVSSIVTVFVFYLTRLYQEILSFAGARFFVNVSFSSTIVSVFIALPVFYFFYPTGFSIGVFPTFALTLAFGTLGTRIFAKWYLEIKSKQHTSSAVIYGSGKGGYELFSALRFGDQYTVVAFIDDDPKNHGRIIRGVKVFPIDKLESLIQNKEVTTVLLAMPSIDAGERSIVISKLQKYNVEIKTTPRLSEFYSGKATLTDIQDLSIEDLMSRPTVQVNEKLAGKCVQGKSVLVTGAGGSIGSELCRQIVCRKPTTIVLFEMSESSLFYIEQELIDKVAKLDEEVRIISVLGSLLDKDRLQQTLLENKVNTLFHAAAYKHVPMLETNPIEGVRNNVIGTKRVAEACSWANIESLVVVSTDKAVRPTNLMGATKRFAELVVQAVAHENSAMRTCMVRFGNVLGSSGSVVPIFREQIKKGGPVKVTHKDMTRYFMTIPEASQLVLQAGAMATDSEIFVLDMGKPKRIYDLARQMIAQHGLSERTEENPAGDIEVIFTQLRPGEKMFEELSIDDCLEQTEHQKISKSIEKKQDLQTINEIVTLLETALKSRDTEEVMNLVCKAVPEYKPSEDFYSRHPNMVIPERANEPTTADASILE